MAEQARLFAMLNMGGADSLISCWDDKAYWSFWRPITAIHEGDNDGNPRTVGDPSWTPFITQTPAAARRRIRTIRRATTARRAGSCTRRRPSSAGASSTSA